MGLQLTEQMKLLDFLNEVLEETNVQIVMTTHSGVTFEYILYKVIFRELEKDDVEINIMYREPSSVIIKAKAIVPKIPLKIDNEIERVLKKFSSLGLFYGTTRDRIEDCVQQKA